MAGVLKRLFVGRPLASDEQEHQRLPKALALPIFSSDAISSTAYATEEILFVTAVGASSLLLGLDVLIPIGVAVAVLLAIVVTSYRQTIFAYPGGGGSYIVSRENLGPKPALLAGASILLDYVLTVAVSISAGVAALISVPQFRGLADQRVMIGLVLIAVITLGNLRGLKESGQLFAVPTYSYIALMIGLVGYGLFREYFGHIDHVPFNAEHFEGARRAGGDLGLFLILKGFSSGAVALTGVEAISDGVPAFRKPESKNAATTLMLMAVILGSLFIGTAVLAHHLQPYPSHEETVLSQMGRAVYGEGPIYFALQIATAAILALAANTAYADFPRLSSIIARDGYLPRQFGTQGDRLVFSNGILFLAGSAALLLIAFGGKTNALIPLYAVGVFTSFTLSQLGMLRYIRTHKTKGWQLRSAISAAGAVATFVVLLIVAGTKFTSGAWVPLVVVPAIIALFLAIKRHYTASEAEMHVAPEEFRRVPNTHSVVIPVGRITKGTLAALDYARSLRPNHVAAVFLSFSESDAEHIVDEWARFGVEVPLEIVHSPYRDFVDPFVDFLDELEDRWGDATITVVIPEFVVNHWYEQALHNQTAARLKLALLFRPHTVVTSVPYHLTGASQDS
ncbi:MAG TPA: APC family permease [Acidimicrobiales bacterium]|nr:APC family permease [Acidimicrobiales bacterium]